MKTATQCKQFYDKHCTNKELGLSMALAEHSSMKVSGWGGGCGGGKEVEKRSVGVTRRINREGWGWAE